jgi:subtilisin family serine protease
LLSEPTVSSRYLVLLREDGAAEGVRLLTERTGRRLLSTADLPEAELPDEDFTEVGLFLDRLALAVVPLTEDQLRGLDAEPGRGPILMMRPEQTLRRQADEARAGPGPSPSADYFRGYRDGVADLVNALAGLAPGAAPAPEYLRGYRDGVARLVAAATADGRPALPPPAPEVAAARPAGGEEQAAWGLRVTGVLKSPYSGEGVTVAVLDSGLDPDHPDFRDGRVRRLASFVPGEDARDRHGHGTHCAGVACGPKVPSDSRLPRYGIAYRAALCAGKVLNNRGEGTEGAALTGLNWALAHGCRVVLMPLGMAAHQAAPLPFYEEVGRRAGAAGAAVIAAAGGHSNRARNNVQPVAIPANVTTFLGVGAVGEDLAVANFSNGGRAHGPGSVDVVAPGVNVVSAWRLPLGDKTVSGTSMAAAHAAGIAALVAEALGEGGRACTARDVFHTLLLSAQPLPLPSTDVGKGLIQAPLHRPA